MQFIDTHTHLFLPEFDGDRKQVVEHAKEEGVQKLLLPNVDSTTIEGLSKMIQTYPEICIPMTGLHPTSVNSDYKKEIDLVIDFMSMHRVCAIGEIGIDLYWDKTFFKEQEEAFRIQIEIAKQNNLPIVIHARESFDEIFKVMDDVFEENLKGVFHAFTGNDAQAKRIIDWGFYIGLGGILTFKNSGLDKVVNNIDISHVVLETDSPYLAPVPKRGKRNESAYIKYIAQKLAEIKNITIEEVAQVTTKNAKQLFNL